ncbi:hypothetical protein ABZU25_15260 [Micromonospora sp. NPDC005215]
MSDEQDRTLDTVGVVGRDGGPVPRRAACSAWVSAKVFPWRLGC